jgi:hypothetical protein
MICNVQYWIVSGASFDLAESRLWRFQQSAERLFLHPRQKA